MKKQLSALLIPLAVLCACLMLGITGKVMAHVGASGALEVVVVNPYMLQIGATKINLPPGLTAAQQTDGSISLGQQGPWCDEDKGEIELRHNGFGTCVHLATRDGVPIVVVK